MKLTRSKSISSIFHGKRGFREGGGGGGGLIERDLREKIDN